MTYHSISSQYITKDKINITILDVIDPAHFVVKESPDLSNASSKARNFLEAEAAMQKYYASVESCFFQLPLKDAIVVVLHKDKFYRAKVIRILTLSAGHLFRVYLVDYGVECSVPRENIYEIARDFLNHPFQAVTIELLGIEPISLIMNKIDLTITYGPVSDWDHSATIYIKDLQKGMCSAYIEVQGFDNLQIYGKLFICYESNPIKCINDELVSKSFARLNEDCWKNIKKIESTPDCSNINEDVASPHSKISVNKNPEGVPCAANFIETESDFGEIKMRFLNPAGKVVAESTLTHDKSTSANKSSELQKEMILAKEIVPNAETPLHSERKNSETEMDMVPAKEIILKAETPLQSERKNSKTEVQLLTQKHLQKLLNKRKSKSPIKTDGADSIKNNNFQAISENKTIISSENSQTNICSNEVQAQVNVITNGNVNLHLNENRNDIKMSSHDKLSYSLNDSVQNCEKNSIDETLIQAESKDAVSKTDEKSKSENISQDQLIAKKRLMKLQLLKKKSLSPVTANNTNCDVMKTLPTEVTADGNIPISPCTNKIEILISPEDTRKIVNENSQNYVKVLDEHLCNKFPHESQTTSETIQETPKSSSRQENESEPMSEGLKQLQKLQRKVRLKQRKELFEKSSEFNQFEELSVNTSCNSSVCDSDSGLNSFSSTSSSSERIER